MSGRLSLSWVNKDRALVGNGAGGYEWVDPDDPRVREVRRLLPAGHVGTSGDGTPLEDRNLLISGDNLHALRSLAMSPRFRDAYRGQVKLAYLDPPFNTGQAFDHYDDALEHSVWLSLMRERLTLVQQLVAPTGSVWVHLDDAEMAYCKVMMDEIFGRECFVATIAWQKRYSRDNRPAIGTVHDYILVYSPMGSQWKHVRNRTPRAHAKQYTNPNNDPNGPWRAIPMTAQGYRKNQMYPIYGPDGSTHYPPKGRCWGMLESRFLELKSAGRIYFGKDGSAQPGVLRYLSEDEGLVPWTWWSHDDSGHSDEAKKEMLELFADEEAFSTPKPERLMERVVHTATDEGDLVLDPFAGSGTTAAVAHKMRRRWATIEESQSTIDAFVAPRLQRVVEGNEPHGITTDVEWAGGGGFEALRVGPSMCEASGSRLSLAEWASGTPFIEAVADQLGYTLDARGQLVGRRGRSRLAVVDGVADDDIVRGLVSDLEDQETLLVAAKGAAPGAAQTLSELSAGSQLLKVPSDLFPRSKVIR